MIASISHSTLKQYSVSLKLWWDFCLSNNLDVYEFSVNWTLKFFTELYRKGASYGSLNSARSALSLIICSEIGVNKQIKRFFKGLHNLRPSRLKYDSTWNPAIVLDYLRELPPNDTLSLEQLTYKLVTLLALITAHRVQTLSLIKVENIHKDPTGYQIWISDRIKTSATNKCQPVLYIPFFVDDSRVCAAKTLDAYLEKTKFLRPSSSHLFLTFKKPHKPASSQSLSRWIKTTLAKSGVNTQKFSAHSTRHSATSTARLKGVNIDLIRSTAGWSQQSSVFAQFYNRPIVNRDDFALAILKH